MKNRKVYAIVCWTVSATAFLSALLISEGKVEYLTKSAIFWLVIGIIWLILGVIHWVNRDNEKGQ